MGSTSLAQQLAKLAVPQTTLLQKDKKRASLLFDSSEAATLTRETVYLIGREGFDDLLSLNEDAFLPFATTLFSEKSKDTERAVETPKFNSELNKTVRRFLSLLSPYFLQRSTHKALEWLIHRFHIHEYNIDDLIFLALPYHETNIFVRILQVVKLKNNGKWLWLKPLQRPGLHLPKSTLYTHAASDVSFLKFICHNILCALQTNHYSKMSSLLTFHCTTCIGALDYAKPVTEAHITSMLPVIMKGLTLSTNPDFSAASYMILAKLIATTRLAKRLLNIFLEYIVLFKIPSLKIEATLLMIIIYQHQNDFEKMSDKAFLKIAEQEWFSGILQELMTTGSRVQPLLKVLIRKGLEMAEQCESARKFVKSLMNLNVGALIPDLIRLVLTLHVSDLFDVQQFYIELLRTIEIQYPSQFDDTINVLMQSNDSSMLNLQENFRILTRGNLNNDSDWCVLEKINHPIPSVRQESVDVLIKNYESYPERRKDFFKSTIINRFNDDDVEVINQCLISDRKLVTKIIDRDILVHILNDILLKCLENAEKYWELNIPALNMLLSIVNNADMESLIVILSFFKPKNSDELRTTKFILDFKNCPAAFLNIIKNNFTGRLSFGHYLESDLNLNCSLSESPFLAKMVEVLKKSTLNKYAIFKTTSVMVLVNLLPANSSFETSNLIIDVIITTSSNIVAKFNKHYLPFHKHLNYLEKIIQSTSFNQNNAVILSDFSIDSPINKYIINVMNILTRGLFYKKKHVARYATVLNKFLVKFAENLTDKVILFLNIASAESSYISLDLQMRCLLMIQNVVEIRQEDFMWSAKEEIIVIFLLVLLKKSPIINTTCDIILKITEIKENDKFVDFLKEILKSKEEILLDCNQLTQILLNINNSHVSSGTVLTSLTNFIFNNKNDEFPLYVQANYLEMTILLTDINIFDKTSKIAQEVLLENVKLTKLQSQIVCSNINRLNPQIAANLKLNTPSWHFIEIALLNDENVINIDGEKFKCPAITAMSMIDREFYHNLNATTQVHLLDTIVTIAAKSDNSDIVSASAKVFKYIDLNATTIIPILIIMRDIQSEKTTVKRKRRISVIPTADLLYTEQWRKGVCVLELVQDKKKFTNTSDLIPILFELLKKCLDFDDQSSVEYPKQLILSSILHCCAKNTNEAGVAQFSENVFNMSLIVQCMRSSWNPQTHHHTLILLAHCATFSPNQVLQNIMAIFTFMGSSYLRHDDAYSFQIISKIIDTIIPILIKDDTLKNILLILGVFVDAILDVPEHRRISLYYQFLRKLDSELYMSYFILLVFRNHVKHANTEKLQAAKYSLIQQPKRIDIAVSLMEEFDAKAVLVTVDHILRYLRELPVDKDDNNKDVIFTMKNYTSKEFRHYKYTIIQFVANLLSSQNIVNKIAGLIINDLMSLEPVYKNLIIHALTYIQVTTKISEKHSNSPQAQYWKVIMHHSYDILDSVNALLTPQMFLLVIKGLLIHSLATVRRRALELLNVKLQHNAEFFDYCSNSDFNDIIISLVNIIKTIASEDKRNAQSEQEIVVQTALLSLKLITRLNAQHQPDKFIQLLSLVTELIKCKDINANILASLILCLAELCSQLKMHSISNLSNFMPVVVKTLKSQRNVDTPSLLLLSVVTAIQKMVDCISLFLTPYLEKIIRELTYLFIRWNSELLLHGNINNNKTAPILNKINLIWDKISTSIQPRVLIPIIEVSYNSLVTKKRLNNIDPLMNLLSKNIEHYKIAVLESHVLDLTTFFLNALQFRSLNKNIAESAVVETHIMKVFVVLILKLSERSFRPLFYKLYDWALRYEDKSERTITFYNLTREISLNLKGLFVLFAGHFLINASAILDQCNTIKSTAMYFEDSQHNILLLENVLATLNGVFEHDTQKFINKERFDVLMQPLADQLENQLGGIESLKQRAKMILIPTIAHFTVATADDSLWKQLNYQICLKMRNGDEVIRIIAVECLTAIVKKVGDDFLPLLPETIPFLAELLEDEIEDVETACQKSIQEMETILGEPLQKYF